MKHTRAPMTVCIPPSQPQGAHLVSKGKQKTWSSVSLLLQPIARSKDSQKYRNYKLGEFSLSTQKDIKYKGPDFSTAAINFIGFILKILLTFGEDKQPRIKCVHMYLWQAKQKRNYIAQKKYFKPHFKASNESTFNPPQGHWGDAFLGCFFFVCF